MSDTPATIPEIRRAIWDAASQNTYTITIAKCRIGWPATPTIYKWAQLLAEVRRMRSTRITSAVSDHSLPTVRGATPAAIPYKRPAYIPDDIPELKRRWSEAHKMFFQREYPQAWKDGHYTAPKWPRIDTSNGMTTFIVNMITWHGFRATRVNVSGRLIEKGEVQESGNVITIRKMIKSRTRKGTADVSSTINGRSYQWEVKAGRDTPSQEQLREQQRERAAGGEYEFVYSAMEFLQKFDGILYG